MTASVQIQIVGDDTGVQAMLRKLDTAFDPIGLAIWMKASVDPYLRARALGRFRAEGDDASGKWEPLQASTASIRAESGFGPTHPINKRTGEMENFILNTRSSFFTTNMGVEMEFPGRQPQGELEDKIKTAQAGRDMPATTARPVLAINETDLAYVLTSLAFYIAGTP